MGFQFECFSGVFEKGNIELACWSTGKVFYRSGERDNYVGSYDF